MNTGRKISGGWWHALLLAVAWGVLGRHGARAAPGTEGSPGPSPLPLVNSVVQFYSLPPDQMARGHPVRMEGLLLYADAEWAMLLFQDETGILFLPPPRHLTDLMGGRQVRLTGVTAVEGEARHIRDLRVEDLGPAELPPPVRLPLHLLTNTTSEAQRVRVTGVVRTAEPLDGERGRLVLDLGPVRMRAYIRHASLTDLEQIHRGFVEVTGLRLPLPKPEADLAPVQLFVLGMDDLTVLEAGPKDPYRAPLITVRDLIALRGSGLPVPLRRVRGRAFDQVVGRSFFLEDGTGRVEVRSTEALLITNGAEVEAVGYVSSDASGAIQLDEAMFRLVSSLPTTPPPRRDKVLSSIEEIRALSPEQAAAQWPVALEAVVTYHDPEWRVLFVAEQGHGVFVGYLRNLSKLAVGDRVRIRGVTAPGGYAPIIAEAEVTFVRRGDPPPPQQPSEMRLLSGLLDCQWVELRATVRGVRRVGPNLELDLATRRGGLTAWLQGWGNQPAPEAWVGLEARAIGVVGARANARRQLTGITLHIPGEAWLEFLEPVPTDPFARETVAISQLLAFRSDQANPRPVKVSGVVTFAHTNGSIALQDETGGLWLRSPTVSVTPGQRIEVVGFPVPGSLLPTLDRPALRIVGPARLPEAVRAAPEALLSGELEGRRVQVEGHLLENLSQLPRPYLTLQEAGTVFHVFFAEDAPRPELARLKPGSRVAVTGVCQVQTDEWRQPRAFRLWAAEGTDVALLAGPPRITRRQMAWAGAAATGAAALAFAWVIALRRKVRQQTRELEERYHNELELKQRYQDLFDHAGDVILVTDADGRLTAANRAAEAAFQTEAAALLGRPFLELFHPDDRSRIEEVMAALRAGKTAAPFEARAASSGSVTRIFELHLQLLRRNGHQVGFECVARDLSERRRLEAQLQQMQRLESVGQLAAGVAHDYNNIMTVILGHTGLLLSEGEWPAPVQESLQEIQRAATRAADLTRQLLAFSRKQVMNVQAANLNEIVSDMGKMLRRLLGEHIELRWELARDLPSIRADVAMIEQVIVNLAVNARDAMPEGGTLTIRTERVTVTDTHLQRCAEAVPGVHVCLSVTDTGIGMDAETMRHIFEPFFTTKPFGKGSGLGLATVFGIVKQHNGWIEVESQPGRGSTFRVYFPPGPAPAAPAKTAEAADLHKGRETILAVEDEPALRLMLVNGLRRLGYQVLAAASGPEALELWRTHRDSIDLVITDMVMPGGLNGRQLAARLREDRPDLKVIFSSGYSHELSAEGLEHLAGAFLPKPYTPKKLAAIVRACLDGRPLGEVESALAGTDRAAR
ncbi:MAG: ATP-binding protein [Limisphaera sp.]|nr:ATP-binding protein [Limisphaera sp.]